MYAQLKSSTPLLGIMKLMNKVEKVISDPQTSKINYDSEFEKLMIQLKEEYNSLFKLRNQELKNFKLKLYGEYLLIYIEIWEIHMIVKKSNLEVLHVEKNIERNLQIMGPMSPSQLVIKANHIF